MLTDDIDKVNRQWNLQLNRSRLDVRKWLAHNYYSAVIFFILSE